MISYLWPTDNSRARAVCASLYASGFIVPLWPNTEYWLCNGVTVSSSALISGAQSSCGISSCASDAQSGVWMCQYTGSLAHLASGGTTTIYSLPSGVPFIGAAYASTYNSVYVISSSGQLYTTSGTGLISIGAPVSPPAWGLSISGTTLFTVSSGSNIGAFALSSSGVSTSGSIASPLNTILNLTTTPNFVGIGGWGITSIGSGASGITSLAFDSVTSNALALRSSSGRVDLYNGPGEVWTFSESLSGITHPTYGYWNPNGTGILVTDPVSGTLNYVSYTLNTISIAQTLSLVDASALTIPNSTTAFVCQPTNNLVTQFNLVGSTWVSGSTFSVTGAASIISTSDVDAAIGYASGVAFLTNTGDSYFISSTVPLTYTPTALALDLNGNVLAAGTSGASGILTPFSGTASGSAITWSGNTAGISFLQDQLLIADSVNNYIRVFGLNNGTTYTQFNTISAQSPSSGVFISPATANGSGGTIFSLGGSGLAYEYQFVGPYGMAYVPTAMVAIYSSGSWSSAVLNPQDSVTAVSFDGSGNLQAATMKNLLYSFNTSAALLTSGIITVYSGQDQTTPLGISAMSYMLGHLWGVSSLNGAVIELF